MSSRSLLLVLLVFTCLQSFTAAQNLGQPISCCGKFPNRTIPLRLITEYKETWRGCAHSGVIFILKNGRRLCADPGVQWVKRHMDRIDQRFMEA